MACSGPSAATHSSYKSLFSRDAGSLTGTSMNAVFQSMPKMLLTMPGRAGADASDGAEWKTWNAGEKVLKSQAMSWYEFMMARQFLDESKTFVHRFEFLMANRSRAYHG
ncbi:uncharacterized protein KRP23_14157 [Phytophthora ramorum]|uniref:uncharacterized protein n=1 Tax=Phytophthora ramorum TaxID=164328 RepID=UPI0030B1E6EE|nr:hypothetical protein KRP23_14157 [Phytophthora ramorum]